MASDYVCGFAFAGDSVALLRKQRPSWQRGRLNGCGGKVEPGETPQEAMDREGAEEVGVGSGWEHFCTLLGDGFCVHFFATEAAPGDVATLTDEPVEWYPLDLPEDALPNLHWLLPMASRLNRHDWPFEVRERHGGNSAIGRPSEVADDE